MLTKAAIALSALNVGILASLIYIYAGNYRQLSSKFSLGLLVFASLLLVENVLALYFNYTMMGLYKEKVASQIMVLRVVETASLMVLGYITWRN